jgi:hypothetical protein
MDVTRAVKDERMIQRAVELAHGYNAIAPASPQSVLAGRGLDLSRELTCLMPGCRLQRVDEVFARVWHYFDQIVFCDDLGDAIRSGTLHGEELSSQIDDDARVLLHIRDIGAEDLIGFRSKPATVLPTQFGDALPELESVFDDLVAEFATEAKLEIIGHSNDDETAWLLSRHPRVPVVEQVAMHAPFFELTPEEDFLTGAATFLVHYHSATVASDIAAAQKYRAPLATGVGYHAHLIERLARGNAPGDVALELNLPILEGAPIRELLKLRADEREHFERFRVALRRAIAARTGATASATSLATEIVNDEVMPALQAIADRLSASKRALGRKSAYSLAVGVLATACGALIGLAPLLAGGAVAGIAGTIAAQAKFADERRDLELSDMYFLWRAAAHAH